MENANQHTPGPWGVNGRLITYQMEGGGTDYLATVERFDGKYKAEQEANAALIARAPELLTENEALKAENERLRAALDAAMDFAEENGNHTCDTDPEQNCKFCALNAKWRAAQNQETQAQQAL